MNNIVDIQCIEVQNCARCGKPHDKIVCVPFSKRPPKYTHFGECPLTNEPILVTISPEE